MLFHIDSIHRPASSINRSNQAADLKQVGEKLPSHHPDGPASPAIAGFVFEIITEHGWSIECCKSHERAIYE